MRAAGSARRFFSRNWSKFLFIAIGRRRFRLSRSLITTFDFSFSRTNSRRFIRSRRSFFISTTRSRTMSTFRLWMFPRCRCCWWFFFLIRRTVFARTRTDRSTMENKWILMSKQKFSFLNIVNIQSLSLPRSSVMLSTVSATSIGIRIARIFSHTLFFFIVIFILCLMFSPDLQTKRGYVHPIDLVVC